MRYYILCSLLSVFLVSDLKAQEKWEELFDGKTFNGWKVLAGKASFQWMDGTIVGTSVATPGNTFLVSERTFNDFILEFEVMVEDSSSNTGVQLRSHYDPEGRNGNGLVYGYQVDIDPLERRWTGGIYDEGRRLWLYPLTLNPAAQPAFKFKKFNHIRVECIGSEIKTWVNGVAAAYVVDTVDTEGFIALQVHAVNKPEYAGRKTYFRNVRIQTVGLKPKPFPNNIYIANYIPGNLIQYERENGWKLISGNERKQYVAFDLSFEFNVPQGVDGSLEYLVPRGGKGLSYHISGESVIRQDKRSLASLYNLLPAIKQDRFVRKPGQWNQGRILVYPDGRVEHYLNGVRLVEYNRFSAEFKQLLAASIYRNVAGFGQWKKGRIVLDDKNGKLSFRSIKLKEL